MDAHDGHLKELCGLHEDELINENALARAFKVSSRTIRRMILREELPPPILLSHKRYWKAGIVRRWIDRLADDALRQQARRKVEREKAEAAMLAL